MKLKHALILLTLISVVADTMLLPFYPQFFAQAFNYDSAQHVGYYIAACCFTVMFAFPIWARIARYINELHLWVYTQIIAGCLGIACFYSESLIGFWIASQSMLLFKASYLLIYPFVMRLEDNDKHLGVVGLFSVLMHFGAIGGAVLGGFILEFMQAKDLYLIMAASDALQVIVCLYLIYVLRTPWRAQTISESMPTTTTHSEDYSAQTKTIWGLTPTILKVGMVALVFYFSAFLIRPFFTKFWQSINTQPPMNSELFTGLVYAIPAWVALLGLWLNHRHGDKLSHFHVILQSLAIGIIGLFIQAQPDNFSVIAGRIIFAWALFQVSVRLEIILFENSSPDRYGQDFSKVHFMQNLGIIASSFTVGQIVYLQGYQWAFYLAMAGFMATFIVFVLCFKRENTRVQSRAEQPENL
ncbi:MFS transporter [Bermanella sp. R86510]|uniref:MFS transporter n=1 Tax=unclassified Bermanella TaxID=2627862 RepID=UPI0037C7C627